MRFSVPDHLNLERLKQLYVFHALRKHHFHRENTARHLGIDVKTLYNNLRQWGFSNRVLTHVPPELHDDYARLVLKDAGPHGKDLE